MSFDLKVKQLLPNKAKWPNKYQERRIQELAIVRDICPDIPTTRAERLEAVRRLLNKITREEATVLLVQLREAPRAVSWRERTPQFREKHDVWVETHGGPTRDLSHLDPFPVAREKASVTLSAAEEQYVKELIGKAKYKKPTAAEVEAWSESRETRKTEDFGEIMIGAWE